MNNGKWCISEEGWFGLHEFNTKQEAFNYYHSKWTIPDYWIEEPKYLTIEQIEEEYNKDLPENNIGYFCIEDGFYVYTG